MIRNLRLRTKNSGVTVARIIENVIFILTLLVFSLSSVDARELLRSGKNGVLDNPFVSFGVNLESGVVTGYLVGLRIAPGRTDECKLVFAGHVKEMSAFSVRYISDVDGYEDGMSKSPAVVTETDGKIHIRMKKDQMGGDCEWILPFIDESRVKDDGDQVTVSLGELIRGDWIGVLAIKSRRAPFYRKAERSSVQDAFLVQGDLIYVYDEKPGWYYVKYQGRKKMTVGWIKKDDTVQIPLN